MESYEIKFSKRREWKRGEKITGLRGGRSVALNDKDAVLLNIYLAMMDEGKEPFFERYGE